jgi:hypothetical protein
MARARIFGLGFRFTPSLELARILCPESGMTTTMCHAQFYRTAFVTQVNSFERASRVETPLPIRSAGEQLSAMRVGIASQYHYRRAKKIGRKSENCCSNCGNLAPWISKVFCNAFISKHLYLFQIGPTLANCVVPAQVHLYWCPKSLSS